MVGERPKIAPLYIVSQRSAPTAPPRSDLVTHPRESAAVRVEWLECLEAEEACVAERHPARDTPTSDRCRGESSCPFSRNAVHEMGHQ